MTRATAETGVVDRDDLQELRLAVVMTGGVSLTVWMAGVTAELSALVRRTELYAELLDLTACDVRIDIISGASAGGINGALLALGVARRSSLDALKKLWVEKGGMADLFRSPLEKNPPSLMKGDSYFLTELTSAFEAMDENGDRQPSSNPPIHLTITTSLLRGRGTGFADDFGASITDTEPRAMFTFTRGSTTHHLSEDSSRKLYCDHTEVRSANDDFADPGVAKKLALAARCSASFPGAFEPSLCPVGETNQNPPRPDMKCYADFRETQFTVDGGVLVNKPIAPALRAIYEEPASRQVRRILAYVVPDPGPTIEYTNPANVVMPTIARTLLDSLVTLPRTESVGNELKEIRRSNERAKQQLRTREAWATLGSLDQRASEVFEAYRIIRGETSVGQIMSWLNIGIARENIDMSVWNPAPLRSALMNARMEYLPREFPSEAWSPSGDEWDWGLQPIENAARTVLDVMSRAMTLVVPGSASEHSETRAAAARIRACRAEVHRCLEDFRAMRGNDSDYWRRRAIEALKSLYDTRYEIAAARHKALADWAANAVANYPIDRSRLFALGRQLSEALLKVNDAVGVIVQSTEADATAPEDARRDARVLGQMRDALTPLRGAGEESREIAVSARLRLLLALDVVQTVFAPAETAPGQVVELMHMTAETPTCLDRRRKIGDKVAGVQLGHFGAFYKRSWRANDWMWGRLDAAYRLVQLLLDPKRLRQRRLPSAAVLSVLETIALGGDGEGPVPDVQKKAWDRPAIAKELEYLDRTELPTPVALPAATVAVATRLQLEIAREELRSVADAVADDFSDGAARPFAAQSFMDGVRRIAGNDRLSRSDAARLFQTCWVGAEKIGDEVGSDLFARTLSTATAVAASAGQGTSSGLAWPLRSFLASLRGFGLSLWAMTRAAVQGSRAGAAFIVAMLAIGGALVALAALAHPPAVVITVGASLLAAGLTICFLRAGSVKALAICLLGIGIAIVPFLAHEVAGVVSQSNESWWAASIRWVDSNSQALSPIFVVVGVIIGSMLLGIVRRRPK
jgi:patatin-related protein